MSDKGKARKESPPKRNQGLSQQLERASRSEIYLNALYAAVGPTQHHDASASTPKPPPERQRTGPEPSQPHGASASISRTSPERQRTGPQPSQPHGASASTSRTSPERQRTGPQPSQPHGTSASTSRTTPEWPKLDYPLTSAILDMQQTVDKSNYQMLEEYRAVAAELADIGPRGRAQLDIITPRIRDMERWRAEDREHMRKARIEVSQQLRDGQIKLQHFLLELESPKTEAQIKMVGKANQEIQLGRQELSRLETHPDNYLPNIETLRALRAVRNREKYGSPKKRTT